MKACIWPKYGSPDVLKIEKIEKPVPKDDEVLIKVHAASINSYDNRTLQANPFFVRGVMGLIKPKYDVLGSDVSGTVESVGKNVKKIKSGDEVYACLSDYKLGGYAEYALAIEKVMAPKPANISFQEAAAVPMAALTALQGLRDVGKIKKGQKVLINGASGGVGTFAVQIAKSYGAEVTGVCNTNSIDVVSSVGADYIIDYTKEDFTKNEEKYDLILDIAANKSRSQCNHSLKEKGIWASVGFSTIGHLLTTTALGTFLSKKDGKKINLVSMTFNTDDAEFMNRLLKSKEVIPAIDREYPLDEIREAMKYMDKGHVKGKVIIKII